MDKEDLQVVRLFEPLWADLKPENQFYNKKPLLAHYTTLATLEQILLNNELWFSNPLYMNDLEEIRFGIVHGLRLLRENESIKAVLTSDERYRTFIKALNAEFSRFDTQHLLNIYVLCFSEHDVSNGDGVLSQWRAYGNNGNGAALILDSGKIGGGSGNNKPLVLAKVEYGSSDQRWAWLSNMAERAATIIEANSISDERIPAIAYALFERITLFALFTKHNGFSEEREWRVVYLPDRDPENKFQKFFQYHNGPRGVEPKLKFPIKPIHGLTAADLSLEKITFAILLGPTTSSPLALSAVRRMVQMTKHPDLANRVAASSIPLRPTT